MLRTAILSKSIPFSRFSGLAARTGRVTPGGVFGGHKVLLVW